MYAVIEVSGKQFRVAKDEYFFVDGKDQDVRDVRVLMVADGAKVITDASALAKATVKIKATGNRRYKVARAMKFRPKQRRTSKRMLGHRQDQTKFTVESITL